MKNESISSIGLHPRYKSYASAGLFWEHIGY